MPNNNKEGESHGIKFYTDTTLPNESKSLSISEALKKEEFLQRFGVELVQTIRVSFEEWEDGLRSMDWVINDIEKALREYKYKQEDLDRLFEGLPLQQEERDQKDKELLGEIERLGKLIDESQEQQKKILEELTK
ncbi:MAG: hypothetical protein K2H85_08010 [Allobaculum sp.]|nr:hypothetical protein [Allobaculum sp.]